MKKSLAALVVAALLTGHFGCSSSADKPDADGKKTKAGDAGSGAKPDSNRPAEGSGD